MEEKSSQLRTTKQNASLHKWCEELANELNNRGLTFKKVVKESFDLDWNKDMVKRVFWQSLAQVKFRTEHTSELTTTQLQDIYNEITRILSDPNTKLGQAGIYMPFPSQETYEEYTKLKKAIDDF